MVAAADTTPSRTSNPLWIGLSVVGMLAVLLVSLPPMLLDVGLSLNLSISLLLLLVVLYVRSPLELSTFPTILLLTTLFRLSLNIASTRLILLNGDQGTHAARRVLEGFGKIMVGRHYAVGVVLFLLVVIVNYL